VDRRLLGGIEGEIRFLEVVRDEPGALQCAADPLGATAGNFMRAALLGIGLALAALPWLQVDAVSFSGKILKIPDRAELQIPVNERLVVELYSK